MTMTAFHTGLFTNIAVNSLQIFSVLPRFLTGKLGDHYSPELWGTRWYNFLWHLIALLLMPTVCLSSRCLYTAAIVTYFRRIIQEPGQWALPEDTEWCRDMWCVLGIIQVQWSTSFIHRHGHRDNPCGGYDNRHQCRQHSLLPVWHNRKQPHRSLLHLVKCLQQRYPLLPHPVRHSHILSGFNRSAASPVLQDSHADPRWHRSSGMSLTTRMTNWHEMSCYTSIRWFLPSRREVELIGTSVTSSSSTRLLGVRIRYRLFKSREHTLDQAKSPMSIAKWLPQSPVTSPRLSCDTFAIFLLLVRMLY